MDTKIKINKEVAAMADAFAEREYETDGYEREWLSKGYYHGFMDAKNGATPESSHELTTQGAKKLIQFVEEGGHVFHPKAYWKDWDGEVPQAGDIVEIVINDDTTFVGKVLYRAINQNVVRCFVKLNKE